MRYRDCLALSKLTSSTQALPTRHTADVTRFFGTDVCCLHRLVSRKQCVLFRYTACISFGTFRRTLLQRGISSSCRQENVTSSCRPEVSERASWPVSCMLDTAAAIVEHMLSIHGSTTGKRICKAWKIFSNRSRLYFLYQRLNGNNS